MYIPSDNHDFSLQLSCDWSHDQSGDISRQLEVLFIPPLPFGAPANTGYPVPRRWQLPALWTRSHHHPATEQHLNANHTTAKSADTASTGEPALRSGCRQPGGRSQIQDSHWHQWTGGEWEVVKNLPSRQQCSPMEQTTPSSWGKGVAIVFMHIP